MEGSVRAVGKMITSVGACDPHLNFNNTMDFRLQRVWESNKREDSPPKCAKHIHISIFGHCIGIAHVAVQLASTSTIAEMIVLAFIFVLRPGAYTSGSSDSALFTVIDV